MDRAPVSELSKVEQLEAKLETMRAEKARAEEAQYEIDLEARIALESEHDAIAGVKVAKFISGQPTRAYLRTPTGAEYKRYKAQMFAAGTEKKGAVTPAKAQEMLAQACWVYPAPGDAQAAMLEAFPGLLSQLFLAAAALSEGKMEIEGKD